MTDTDYLLSAPANAERLMEAVVELDAAALQRAYRAKRMRWARKIGRPYADDLQDLDPGVLDIADETEG